VSDNHIKEPEKFYDDEFSSELLNYAIIYADIYEKVLNHWVKLINHFFPRNAKFRVCTVDYNYSINIDWKINEKSEGLQEKSLKIIIIDEAINDYIFNYSPGSHKTADIRFKAFVSDKMKNRDDDISESDSQIEEKWIITTDILS
jgi:hypothetical protein